MKSLSGRHYMVCGRGVRGSEGVKWGKNGPLRLDVDEDCGFAALSEGKDNAPCEQHPSCSSSSTSKRRDHNFPPLTGRFTPMKYEAPTNKHTYTASGIQHHTTTARSKPAGCEMGNRDTVSK